MAPAVSLDVGGGMRPGDAEECAAYGFGPIEGVALSIQKSLHTRAMWEPGHGYGAAWGLVTIDALAGPAYLWLLTTDRAVANKKALFYEGKRFLADAVERYGIVEAYVLISYVKSVTWLKRWGFTMDEVVQIGGQDFFIARKRAG